MQVLQAGPQKLLLLELDPEVIGNVAKQAGFQCKVEDGTRLVRLELTAEKQSPLLLFDASDPGNLGWFSRCQFYVDGTSGVVLQTPILMANLRDRGGRPLPNVVRLQVNKELPAGFRLPGKQPLNEQVVYVLLFNFLSALVSVGVGVCGNGVVKPLAGRTEGIGSRN